MFITMFIHAESNLKPHSGCLPEAATQTEEGNCLPIQRFSCRQQGARPPLTRADTRRSAGHMAACGRQDKLPESCF